jgi:hypothetical protein
MNRKQPTSGETRRRSSRNATKHGLTARLDIPLERPLATLKLVDAFAKGSRDPEILHAAEQLAELQMTLASVRRAKAFLINRSIGPVRDATDSTSKLKGRDRAGPFDLASRESSEAKAIADNLERLATLDTYERRTLSRRRKAAFALLLAFEETVEESG